MVVAEYILSVYDISVLKIAERQLEYERLTWLCIDSTEACLAQVSVAASESKVCVWSTKSDVCYFSV